MANSLISQSFSQVTYVVLCCRSLSSWLFSNNSVTNLSRWLYSVQVAETMLFLCYADSAASLSSLYIPVADTLAFVCLSVLLVWPCLWFTAPAKSLNSPSLHENTSVKSYLPSYMWNVRWHAHKHSSVNLSTIYCSQMSEWQTYLPCSLFKLP